jgi:hypothetical protein
MYLSENKYLIWKHKRKRKIIAQYYSSANIIKSENSVNEKKKKKRRKLNLIINLMKIPIFESQGNLKKE